VLHLFCAVCFSTQDPFLFSAPVVDLRPDFVLLCLVPPVHACPIFSPQRIRELRVKLGLPALISRFGSCFSCRSFASRIWSCRHLGHCGCRPALPPGSYFCSSLVRGPRFCRCLVLRPPCRPYFPLLRFGSSQSLLSSVAALCSVDFRSVSPCASEH
jgi:hypothetical protein